LLKEIARFLSIAAADQQRLDSDAFFVLWIISNDIDLHLFELFFS